MRVPARASGSRQRRKGVFALDNRLFCRPGVKERLVGRVAALAPVYGYAAPAAELDLAGLVGLVCENLSEFLLIYDNRRGPDQARAFIPSSVLDRIAAGDAADAFALLKGIRKACLEMIVPTGADHEDPAVLFFDALETGFLDAVLRPGQRPAPGETAFLRAHDVHYHLLVRQLNERILADNDTPEILKYLCNQLVESWGFAGVLITRKMPDGSVATQAASDNLEEGELSHLNIRWDNTPFGQGSVGRAIRSGRPQRYQVADNPVFRPWWEFYRNKGIKSLAAFPLQVPGDVTGAIVFFAGQAISFFSNSLMLRLEVFAAGVALAIKSSETRRELEMFRLLAEYSPDIFLYLSFEGRILDANQAAVAAYGYTREELRNLAIGDLRAPQTLAELESHLLLARGEGVRFETIHRRRDGSLFSVEVSARAVAISGERMILSVIRDITERKQWEKQLFEQREQFRVTLASIGDAVIATDTAGEVTFINPAAEHLTGYSQAEALGRPVTTVFHIHNELTGRPAEIPIQRVLQEGVVVGLANHTVLLSRDGRLFPIADSAAPIRDEAGNLCGVVMVFQDSTERRAAEERIKRLSRMYLALARTNDAIAFTTDETALFDEVCRIAVEHGRISMCWIGCLDDNGFIKPAAAFGFGTVYLGGLVVSARADQPEGCGPDGLAIRTNRPVVVTDYQADVRIQPWRERGASFGWRASASFPVPRSGRPYAVLSVNYTESGLLDEDTIDLLAEMAKNVSRALDRLDEAAEHRRAVRSLAQSEAFNRGLIESTHEGVCVWDAGETIVFVNRRALEIFGYSPDDEEPAFAQPMARFLFPGDPADYRRTLSKLKKGQSSQFERRARHRSGSEIHLLVSATPRFDQNGAYAGGFAMFTDITERKAAQAHIERLARFDDLTGLPNRIYLAERFREAVQASRAGCGYCSLMFLDLDHFKNINDALGHHVGDQLLITTARRIARAIRSSDTVCRLGGDEFILLLPDTGTEGAVAVARELISIVGQPVAIDQYELTATPSIGIAIYPSDGEDLETLYRCADIAMYQVKQAGRNSLRLFTSEMRLHSEHKMRLLAALRRALENGELTLHYQPQLSLHLGRVVGVEALLRWRHPLLGLIPNHEFIPLAEESGLILPIGEWVLRTAVQQLKAWLEAGLPPMTMAVNLSAIQLRQSTLAATVRRVLQEAGLSGQHLELELTESVAMKQIETASAVMRSLDRLGVQLAIDDFGTGYSSLAYLNRFGCSRLKIDQSFVQDIAVDPKKEALVKAIITLAGSLGLRTIAEGVETEAQVLVLRRNGCDEVQGYYISHPLPAEDLFSWIVARSRS